MGTIIAILLAVLGLFAQAAGSPATCKRRGCNEPRRGTQFCSSHECEEPGCSSAPKKASSWNLCRVHDEQVEAEMEPKELRVGFVAPPPEQIGGYDQQYVALRKELVRVMNRLWHPYPAIVGVLSANQSEWEFARWLYRRKLPWQVIAPAGQDKNWPVEKQVAYERVCDFAASCRLKKGTKRRSAKEAAQLEVAESCDILIAAVRQGSSASTAAKAAKRGRHRKIPVIVIEITTRGEPINTTIYPQGGEETPF